MEQKLFNEKDIRNREKKNKLGRCFLWIGLFISIISTLIVCGLILANNTGLAPNSHYGFNVIRTSDGQNIVKNYANKNQIDLVKDIKVNVLSDTKNDTYLVKETENTKRYEHSTGGETYFIELDTQNKTYSFYRGDYVPYSYDEASTKYEAFKFEFVNSVLSYKTEEAKKILDHKDVKYFYNKSENKLKAAITSSEYAIFTNDGICVERRIKYKTIEGKAIFETLKQI